MGQRKHVRRFTLTWKIGSITICTSIELKKHRWAWLRWAILSPLLAAYRPSIGYPWVPPNSLADHQYHTYDIQVCIYIYIYILSYYIIIYHLYTPIFLFGQTRLGVDCIWQFFVWRLTSDGLAFGTGKYRRFTIRPDGVIWGAGDGSKWDPIIPSGDPILASHYSYTVG